MRTGYTQSFDARGRQVNAEGNLINGPAGKYLDR